jgi:hypothetical protein
MNLERWAKELGHSDQFSGHFDGELYRRIEDKYKFKNIIELKRETGPLHITTWLNFCMNLIDFYYEEKIDIFEANKRYVETQVRELILNKIRFQNEEAIKENIKKLMLRRLKKIDKILSEHKFEVPIISNLRFYKTEVLEMEEKEQTIIKKKIKSKVRFKRSHKHSFLIRNEVRGRIRESIRFKPMTQRPKMPLKKIDDTWLHYTSKKTQVYKTKHGKQISKVMILEELRTEPMFLIAIMTKVEYSEEFFI